MITKININLSEEEKNSDMVLIFGERQLAIQKAVAKFWDSNLSHSADLGKIELNPDGGFTVEIEYNKNQKGIIKL